MIDHSIDIFFEGQFSSMDLPEKGVCLKMKNGTIWLLTSSTARLLLIEPVIPGPNEVDFSKFLDLEMLVVTEGGKERTKEEFEKLLASAGFQMEKIAPTISMAHVIEARPV